MMKMKSLLVALVGASCLYIGVAKAENAKLDKPSATSTQSEKEIPPEQKPLIMVNDEALTSQSYISYLQSNPSIVSRATSSEEGKAEALRELVASQLLKKALFDEGFLKVKDGEVPSQKEIIDGYEKLADKHFPVPPKPDEKASFDYYQSHQNDYGIPAVTRLGEIYIKHAEGADNTVVEAARQRAENVLKRIASGEKFKDVAAAETDNPVGKVTHGDIGFQQVDEIPWLKEATKSLKVGERTGIVETPTGFLILEVTDRRSALISPYANVRDKVIQAMREQGQKKQRDAYAKELSKSAKIEIIEPDLKKLFPNGIFP